jgi:hypothetical protein
VEDIDCACDLSKVGGLNALLAVLRSPHATLRAAAAEVLATAAQNNPKAQQQLLDGGVMERLLPLAREDADDTVRLKGLLALGCASLPRILAHPARAPADAHAAFSRRLDTQLPARRGGVQARGRLWVAQGAWRCSLGWMTALRRADAFLIGTTVGRLLRRAARAAQGVPAGARAAHRRLQLRLCGGGSVLRYSVLTSSLSRHKA